MRLSVVCVRTSSASMSPVLVTLIEYCTKGDAAIVSPSSEREGKVRPSRRVWASMLRTASSDTTL